MTIEFRCTCRQRLRVPDDSIGKNARCPQCQTLLRIPLPYAPFVDNRLELPWEQPGSKSLGRYAQTARLIAFSPATAFSQMKQRGRVGEAMLYSALGQFIGVVGLEFWHLTFVLIVGLLLKLDVAVLQNYLATIGLLALANIFLGVPLMATLGNLIGGAILHFCLILCGGSRQPFSTSIRISCYCQSSISWLMWIPGGLLLVGVWSIGLQIYAVHQAHEVPMGRAVLAVLLPMIVVSILLVITTTILAVVVISLLMSV